jgi:hypothetical protein
MFDQKEKRTDKKLVILPAVKTEQYQQGSVPVLFIVLYITLFAGFRGLYLLH